MHSAAACYRCARALTVWQWYAAHEFKLLGLLITCYGGAHAFATMGVAGQGELLGLLFDCYGGAHALWLWCAAEVHERCA